MPSDIGRAGRTVVARYICVAHTIAFNNYSKFIAQGEHQCSGFFMDVIVVVWCCAVYTQAGNISENWGGCHRPPTDHFLRSRYLERTACFVWLLSNVIIIGRIFKLTICAVMIFVCVIHRFLKTWSKLGWVTKRYDGFWFSQSIVIPHKNNASSRMDKGADLLHKAYLFYATPTSRTSIVLFGELRLHKSACAVNHTFLWCL